jgi:hypothetical protein
VVWYWLRGGRALLRAYPPYLGLVLWPSQPRSFVGERGVLSALAFMATRGGVCPDSVPVGRCRRHASSVGYTSGSLDQTPCAEGMQATRLISGLHEWVLGPDSVRRGDAGDTPHQCLIVLATGVSHVLVSAWPLTMHAYHVGEVQSRYPRVVSRECYLIGVICHSVTVRFVYYRGFPPFQSRKCPHSVLYWGTHAYRLCGCFVTSGFES